MVSRKTLERYIQQLDEVISSGNAAVAKELQNEIIAVFSTDLDGLKKGLTNYSAVGAFSDSRTGKTIVVGDELDFIKDARTLRSRLLMELDKVEEKDMRNMMKKAAQNVKAVAVRAGMLMKDTKGENYVDTAVKILIAVVLGALLLAGLYALFGDVVMPTLTQRIQDMFNYAG